MLARAVLTILYLWHKQQHQISKQNNDTNKVAMDENKLNQLNFEGIFFRFIIIYLIIIKILQINCEQKFADKTCGLFKFAGVFVFCGLFLFLRTLFLLTFILFADTACGHFFNFLDKICGRHFCICGYFFLVLSKFLFNFPKIFFSFSIRRFSNGTLFRQQRHYENKFWEVVGKIRAEKNLRQPDDRIYTPVFISKIIDEDAAKELMSALPQRFQLETPKLLFRLSEHGTSFVQLWTRIEQADQSLLIIKSTTREVFGAYVSSSWAERNDVHERAKAKYFGTGESFVWRLDDELKLPIIYTCGGGDAIAIRDELVEGSSRASRTYQSPELVSGGQFQIDELEVWSIPSSI
uniref:TLDc domain-containing protein n=1 Tax=Meloidogyne incognita TaxID=6306 RepID=A0A914MAQ3_MELIC